MAEISPWRPSGRNNRLLPVPRKRLQSIEKLKLFQQAVDYIITSRTKVSSLVLEICGLDVTLCEAFKELSNDDSWLFANTITREITYLLVLCCFKDNNIVKDLDRLIHMPSDFVQEVSIIGNNIGFTVSPYDQVTIKVDKLRSNYLLVDFRYTTKLAKLNMEEVFHNHTYTFGKCRGLVKYWLEELCITYSLPKSFRSQQKIRAIKGLEVISNANGKIIKDFTVRNKVENYQFDEYGYRYLKNIFDIYSTIENLPITLESIIEKMKLHCLFEIYIQIVVGIHALGIAIIARGNAVKFFLIEPNDENLYLQRTIHMDDLNIEVYKNICNQFKYLVKKDAHRSLLVKAYMPNSIEKDIPHYKEECNLNMNEYSLSNLTILLSLAITNHDCNLIRKILRTGSINVNNVLENNMTPLIMAIGYKDPQMVKLFIDEYDADVNIRDRRGKSPLGVAQDKGVTEILDLLIASGATT